MHDDAMPFCVRLRILCRRFGKPMKPCLACCHHMMLINIAMLMHHDLASAVRVYTSVAKFPTRAGESWTPTQCRILSQLIHALALACL